MTSGGDFRQTGCPLLDLLNGREKGRSSEHNLAAAASPQMSGQVC